jgi:cytidylate kinase
VTAIRSGVIAIDGPVASGKTSVAVGLAERLEALVLDTGLFYRALAWVAAERGIDPNDALSLARAAQRIEMTATRLVGARAHTCRALVDGADVTDKLSSRSVEAIVSAVARHPEVRAALVEPQRRAVAGRVAVAAGRDMGTRIFPDARLKVFLQARPETRARRRAAQKQADGPVQEATVLQAILERDAADAAQSAPAPDAVTLDTTDLTLEQVVDRIEALLKTDEHARHSR